MTENENVTELLNEEAQEEELFREKNSPHKDTLNPGMRNSATTDTLDSVYLDPPNTEPEGVEKSEVLSDSENISSLSDNSYKRMAGDSGKDVKSQPEVVFSFEGQTDANKSPPSLSKYFGKSESTEDFFSSIPPVEENLPPATDIEVELLDNKVEGDSNAMSGSDPFGLYTNKDDVYPSDVQLEDAVGEMTDLTLNSTQDILQFDDEPDSEDNQQPSAETKQFEVPGSVDFDLALEANDIVETPVDVEEKEGFESFTAELADTEAMDALGMSPAAPSFMKDSTISDYFRQSSNLSDEPFGGISRQMSQASQASGRSSLSQDRVLSHVDETGEPRDDSPEHVQNSDSSIPAPDLSQGGLSGSESVESTPSHKPVFPPSTTLSPGESPAHQPFFKATGESITGHLIM